MEAEELVKRSYYRSRENTLNPFYNEYVKLTPIIQEIKHFIVKSAQNDTYQSVCIGETPQINIIDNADISSFTKMIHFYEDKMETLVKLPSKKFPSDKQIECDQKEMDSKIDKLQERLDELKKGGKDTIDRYLWDISRMTASRSGD